MTTRSEVVAGLERALADLDDARQAAERLNDPGLVEVAETLFMVVERSWLDLDGARSAENDSPGTVRPAA